MHGSLFSKQNVWNSFRNIFVEKFLFHSRVEWEMSSKPGEKALEAIKKLNAEVSLFKVPRAPQLTKKLKMKILTEEQYIQVCVLIAQAAMCNYRRPVDGQLDSHEIAFSGVGQHYSEGFLPGFGKIESTESILGGYGEEWCDKVARIVCEIQWKDANKSIGW